MLSNSNKQKLRKLAHSLPSMIQIGKSSLSENLFVQIDNDLEAHELVKITMQKTCDLPVRDAAIECAAQTGSEIVQIIGRTFILYRRSKDNKLGIKA
jgi:RNA-binding protein